MADTHCDKSINRTDTPCFATPQVEYIKSALFHIIQSSLNISKYWKHSSSRDKNVIMHFLRLLLFFFVLLAPLQLTTALKRKQCSRGPIRIGSTAASCRSCCKKCLETFYGSGIMFTPKYCRKYCKEWRSCWTGFFSRQMIKKFWQIIRIFESDQKTHVGTWC